MRNAGIIGSVLIGVGYFVNKGKFMGSDHFATDEEAFMAEKKARFRHTFDGDGQAEFEGSYLKFSKDLPHAWIIEKGVAPLSSMITNNGNRYFSRNRMPKKGAYNEAVSEALDNLENIPEDDYMDRDNQINNAWRHFMTLITANYRGHDKPPTALPPKEQLFRLLIESKDWVKNHPQVRTLADDSVNKFQPYQGYGRRTGGIKLRMYGKEPKIFATGADYRIAIPISDSGELYTIEEEFDNHLEKLGIDINGASYYSGYGRKGTWLSPTPLPANERGYVQLRQMPEYYRNRYSSLTIIPPLSWWPTDEDIDGWYSRLQDIFGGEDSPADAEMRKQWDDFKGWITSGTTEQPIPTPRHGNYYGRYNWGGGARALETLKRFKGMPDYDVVVKKVRANIRANIALTKGYLKDL
jgi:hypothetical protein